MVVPVLATAGKWIPLSFRKHPVPCSRELFNMDVMMKALPGVVILIRLGYLSPEQADEVLSVIMKK